MGRAETGGDRQADEQPDEAGSRGDRCATPHRESQRRGKRPRRAPEDNGSDRTCDENRCHLPRRAGQQERNRCCGRRERQPQRPPRKRPRHRDHSGRHDCGSGELEPVHPPRPCEIDAAGPDRDGRENRRRRQREAKPGSERSELARAMRADRDPDLARRRARQEVREGHELGELLFAEPATAGDVLLAEVPDVRDGASERRQPEAKSDAEDLTRRLRDGTEPLTQRRDAPGFQSGSSTPADAFAARARMNSRSESRFRYTATSGFTSCSPAARSASRSARRQTVRATWSQRRGRGAAWEDEALQLRQRLVEGVAEPLQVVDHRLLDAQPSLDLKRDAEVGPDVEELVLDPFQRSSHVRRAVGREHDAEERVQLVGSPERGDARVELRDPRAVAERRLPRVTATRVDARETDGLVGSTGHGVSLPPDARQASTRGRRMRVAPRTAQRNRPHSATRGRRMRVAPTKATAAHPRATHARRQRTHAPRTPRPPHPVGARRTPRPHPPQTTGTKMTRTRHILPGIVDRCGHVDLLGSLNTTTRETASTSSRSASSTAYPSSDGWTVTRSRTATLARSSPARYKTLERGSRASRSTLQS